MSRPAERSPDPRHQGSRRTTLGLLAGVPVSIAHTETEHEIRIPSFRNAASVVALWVQTAALVLGAAALGHPLAWCAVFILFGRSHAQFNSLMHEGAHRLLFRHRPTNDWASRWLLGYPAFAEHLFRQMFFTPSELADAIVKRAVRSSAGFGPLLWPDMNRWDAGKMDAALAAVKVPVLVIQSTTRSPELKRTALKPGETSPYLDLMKKSLKNVRIEVVPAGHFTMLEAAPVVNRLIEEFARANR